jgi:hypothetical protein
MGILIILNLDQFLQIFYLIMSDLDYNDVVIIVDLELFIYFKNPFV